MKTKEKLTMLETNYNHIETSLDKLFEKLDRHEEKVDNRFRLLERVMYIGFGIVLAMQFLVSNGIIKVG